MYAFYEFIKKFFLFILFKNVKVFNGREYLRVLNIFTVFSYSDINNNSYYYTVQLPRTADDRRTTLHETGCTE